MSTHHSHAQMRSDLITEFTRILAIQYEGWRSDYIGSLEDFPDEPIVIDSGFDALTSLDAEFPPDISFTEVEILQKLSHELSKGQFMSWGAMDPKSHTFWDPLLQSYKDFKKNHPSVEPFLASPKVAASLEQQILGFFLQHGRK
jgi:hypothetical protein